MSLNTTTKTEDLLPQDIQTSIKAKELSDDPKADGISPDSPDDEIAQFWKSQLDDARRREEKYRKDARPVVRIYETADKKADSFNILYSNTETLLPAVYNAVPRPVVKRKQAGNDGPGGTANPNNQLELVATRVAQRLLDQFIDTGATDSPNFDELSAQSVLQALVTGRGLMRFRYDADIEDEVIDGQTVSKVKYENVRGELVDWDRVLFGYARSWTDVPWLAFEHYMSRSELVDNFGDIGKDVPLNASTSDTESEGSDSNTADEADTRAPADSKGAKLALVYEIWDKTKKQVLFYAPSHEDAILKQLDDPLGLTGFFPCPAPLCFFNKVSSMVPVPLYQFYKEQAEELNRVSKRINKIIKALKVRGFYDSQLGSLEKLLQQDDNVLLPAENVAAMQQGQTLEKSIWLMPLTELVAVLQQLYVQRTQVKALIYEITGISDIVRGASAASETLGAQKIKESWVTLRIKRLQKAVHKYLRNSLRIMAEIALTKLSPETVQAMTGVDLPTDEQKQQAQMELQMWQQQQAAVHMPPMMSPSALGGPPVGMGGPPAAPAALPAPGAPPAPSNGMPAAAAPPAPAPAPMMPTVPVGGTIPAGSQGPLPGSPAPGGPPPKLLETLNTPTMVEVLAMLNDNLQRRYHIDIETNSTVDAEATEDKQQVGEFLNAMAQFLSGVAPLVQNGSMPFDAAQAIMLSVTRRYRFGDEVEEALKKMKQPETPKDPKAETEKAKLQMEMEKGKQEMELAKQKGQLELQMAQMKMELEKQKMQLEQQKMQMEHQMANQDMQHKQELGSMQHQHKIGQMNQKAQVAQMQAQQAMKQAQMAPAPASAAPATVNQGGN